MGKLGPPHNLRHPTSHHLYQPAKTHHLRHQHSWLTHRGDNLGFWRGRLELVFQLVRRARLGACCCWIAARARCFLCLSTSHQRRSLTGIPIMGFFVLSWRNGRLESLEHMNTRTGVVRHCKMKVSAVPPARANPPTYSFLCTGLQDVSRRTAPSPPPEGGTKESDQVPKRTIPPHA